MSGCWHSAAGFRATSSLSFDVRRIQRRLRVGRRGASLERRPDRELRFASPATVPPGTGLLLDTCVYIDGAADRLPHSVAELLTARLTSHSTVCVGELVFGLGAMRPEHPRTRASSAVIIDIVERIAGGRIIEPDAETWAMSGMLAGTATRLQRYAVEDRRRILADALVMVSALKAGLTVLTANIADFDPLQQLLPEARIAFYRPI